MQQVRRQLSLYVPDPQRAGIDAVRAVLDPVQHALIPAHVTLCREDELSAIDAAALAERLAGAAPITLRFGAPERFAGHGILMPCGAGEAEFHALRQQVLGHGDVRRASPHLTLAHPRNPRAPGNDLANAMALHGGITLRFEQAHLIEQVDGGTWQDLATFDLAPRCDLDIRIDDLNGPEIQALLAEHLRGMHAISPPESVHALDLDGLRDPRITFWSVWNGEVLLGCGALKQLDARHGEVKSMRTTLASRRRGVGRAMLMHIVDAARRRGYARLSLETGSQPAFEPARRLYASFGFVECAPFADYRPDPNSVFMTLDLGDAAT
jgi:putative acetyltransferase